MSKIPGSFVALVTLLLLPGTAVAQEYVVSPQPLIYATYFECDATNEWLADMIIETVYKPFYDAAVADQTISAWGWQAHHIGGTWRRSLFRVAPNWEALHSGIDSIVEKVREANGPAVQKLREICSTHEDYVWRAVSGSGEVGSVDIATDQSKAAVSMYLVCDSAKEPRADELMAVFAPVYNRHVKDGELSSWGWFEHRIGGEYRRLLAIRGADHQRLPRVWAVIFDELKKEHGDAYSDFAEICYAHQDYLWNVIH